MGHRPSRSSPISKSTSDSATLAGEGAAAAQAGLEAGQVGRRGHRLVCRTPLAGLSLNEYIQPYTIKTIQGVRVAVIGLSVKGKTTNSSEAIIQSGKL